MIPIVLVTLNVMALAILWRAHRHREQVMDATSNPRTAREHLRHRRYRIDP